MNSVSQPYLAGMDPISDILSHLDFRGMLYFSTRFSGKWGVHVPADEYVIRFHLVLRGTCHARIGRSSDHYTLKPGDFLMIPRGQEHDIMGDPRSATPPLETVLSDAGYSGTGPLIYGLQDHGEPTRMLCGHFVFDTPPKRQSFLNAFPDQIIARNLPDYSNEWLMTTLLQLEHETQEQAPGHDAILHRMTEILFVQAIRVWMKQQDIPKGVLLALADKQISKALTALHAAPEQPWTVAELGTIAGMSRSVFAQRFHQLTNTTPLRYLTEWRLQKARKLLGAGSLSVEKIAEGVGYRSVASFSRVYAREFGEGPGSTRRAALQRVA
ncbi:cupin domain-containing protein [Pseudohalocynthiibacter sp. F2068]|nr:cupin domain-containing protein [Pseudohalocynthiibacter sp. F2068]